MKMFFFVCFFSFFFSFCSRHVATCLVRITESVFSFRKETATFVPARKYSQENTAKTVRKRLNRLFDGNEIAVIAVFLRARPPFFTATCRRGLWVNKMENDPLTSFMC